MAMCWGDKKMMSSGAVKNEHKHCDPKGQERHDPCERQDAVLIWTVDWQVCETCQNGSMSK